MDHSVRPRLSAVWPVGTSDPASVAHKPGPDLGLVVDVLLAGDIEDLVALRPVSSEARVGEHSAVVWKVP